MCRLAWERRCGEQMPHRCGGRFKALQLCQLHMHMLLQLRQVLLHMGCTGGVAGVGACSFGDLPGGWTLQQLLLVQYGLY